VWSFINIKAGCPVLLMEEKLVTQIICKDGKTLLTIKRMPYAVTLP